jgi:DHA2 family multidrug resistance protein
VIEAGRTVSKMDPRMLVCIGYGVTAAGLYHLTSLSLDTSFGDVTLARALQVIGLPLVFIPISTLNYVGVPPSKSNQISSLSNFARNLGGSAGTALLTTFLARTAQTHQTQLAAHTGSSDYGYRTYVADFAAAAQAHGMSAGQAGQVAAASAYQQMLRQASMLSYKNAFFMLSAAIFCLMPLPFLMRLPTRRVKLDPEAMGH